jgi:hypothetical protein
MSRDPAWLPEAHEVCREFGINIMAWGPDMLTVEAKSAERARQIESQLAALGFKAIRDEDNTAAGLLSFSKNPQAVQAKIASFDISRRRWDEQIVPLIWAICSLLLIPGFTASNRRVSWLAVPVGLLTALMFFVDSARIWGWKLDLGANELRVRRYYRWHSIRWNEIRAVDSVASARRAEEVVLLRLNSGTAEKLGSFNCGFARNLRDRLRMEIGQRTPAAAS